MALQRDARYPGRWTTASAGHPQGAFKNRSAPGSLDGSYIEQDWANDWDGFFGSLLTASGITANGTVDAVGASQYFTAMKTLMNLASPVGSIRNGKMSVTTAGVTTATFTADQVVLTDGITGGSYRVNAVSKLLNLAITGAGGMDNGTATANGFLGIYLIYNPLLPLSTTNPALLGQVESGAILPSVYGGAFMPAGYTASSLVSIAPIHTVAGQFAVMNQVGNHVDYLGASVLTASSAIVTALPRPSTGFPYSAKFVSGFNQVSSSAASAISQILLPTSNGNVGGQFNTTNVSAASSQAIPFRVAITLPQNIYQSTSNSAGTPGFTISVKSYEF